MSPIADRISNVRERIARAAETAGSDLADITLIAVSKTVEPDRIRQAVAAGIDDLGENYYQEARGKIAALGPDIRWHFIGHLQTNKAKYIPGVFHLLHSVDSVELATELDNRARQKEILQKVLIEVKLDPSATKNGVEPANMPALADVVMSCPNLRLMGLMGMAPVVERQDQTRPHFAALRNLSQRLPLNNRTVLSMGMTADFEAAVLEGSTLVRIGSAIFGQRLGSRV